MVRAASKRPYDEGGSTDRLRDAKARMIGTAKNAGASQAPYPSVNEPALVHPWNNSLIKLRDNGVVDVFANTDNGIRINPNAKTIDMFTQTVKHHTQFIRSFVKRDEIHDIGGFWIINANTARIYTKGSTDIQAGINAIIKAKGSVNIEGGSVNIKSKGTMKFNAPLYDFN